MDTLEPVILSFNSEVVPLCRGESDPQSVSFIERFILIHSILYRWFYVYTVVLSE